MFDSKTARRTIAAVATLTLIAITTVGCAGGTDAGETASAEAAVPGQVAEATADDRPAPPPPPRFETVTIPEGTLVAIAFDDGLSSETAVAGDTFTATVTAPVSVDGRLVVAEGARVSGEVVEAVPGKKIGGTARLDLAFTEMAVSGGGSMPIAARILAEGKRQTKKDAATIGGATAGGALLGNILGDRKGKEADGTKIGAVVGAAVGTAIAATNENDPVVIEAGAVVDIALEAPVTYERSI